MGPEALLTVVGGFVLAGVGYVVLQVVGDVAADEAKEAVFRRASFAARRSRHRALMKTGFVCAMLAFLAALFWLAALTSGREEDAGDARIFAILTAVIALAAGGLLATWWRRAGTPPAASMHGHGGVGRCNDQAPNRKSMAPKSRADRHDATRPDLPDRSSGAGRP